MAQLDAKDALRAASKAWERKEQWRSLYDQCFDLALPERNLYTKTAPGAERSDHIWDSTAVIGAARFANRMLAQINPASFDIELGPASEIPDEERSGATAEIEAEAKAIKAALSLGAAQNALLQVFGELAVGTAAMLIMRGDERYGRGPVVFHPVPIAQVAIEAGAWGEVDRWFRRFDIDGRNIEATWPDAAIPADLAQRIKDKPEAPVELHEITYLDPDDLRQPFRYEVFWRQSDNDGTRLVERQSRVSPWVTPRWSVSAGETYGRGPLTSILPDIRTANKATEMILKTAALNMLGVYTVRDDGVINPDTVSLVAGGMIPVASNSNADPSIRPLELGKNFSLDQLVIEQIQMRIKQVLMDDTLPPDVGGVRSATEIAERMRVLRDNQGAAYYRQEQELVIPMIRRVGEVLFDVGIITTDNWADIDQRAIRVVVTSPLARAQALDDVSNVLDFMQIVAGLAGPERMQMELDAGVFQHLGEEMGIPSKLLPGAAKVKQSLQKMADVAMAEGGEGSPVAAPSVEQVEQ